MIEYVVCVALNNSGDIILIKKQHPEWQKGKFNFVGGKVESYDKDIYETAQREFREETGVDYSNWKYVGKMLKPDVFLCHIFYAKDDKFNFVETTTDEEVYLIDVFKIDEIDDNKFINNVKWIYQALIDGDDKFLRITYNNESDDYDL